jgi:zinc protease
MTTRRLLAIALAALVACGGGSKTTPTGPTTPPSGEGGTAQTPTAPATGEDAPLPLWSKVKKGKLANGLTYYILPHGKPEKRAFLWLAVNAGSVQEDNDQRGLAHFDEHMAFNGTKRFPEQAIVTYLEKIGMGFGADLNASTSFDETIYKLTVPTDNKEFVGKGLDILRDWAGDITFDQGEIDKERGVVLEEWRLGRGAQMRLFDKHSKVLFKGSRYAERLPIGLPDIIKSAPRDALVRYYKDWYRPDLMAVIAVGDVDPVAMEKEIAARFSDLKNPQAERSRIKAGVPPADGTRISIETDREMPVSVVEVSNVVAHLPEASRKDFRRIVAEQIYGQIMNERLSSIARRADSPFIGAQVGVQGFVREVSFFSRTAAAKTGKVEDSLRALFTEVMRVEKHGFTQAELDRARASIKRYYEQIAAEADTEESSSYVAEITRNFFEGEFMIGRHAERDLTLEFLPKITVDELNALVTSYGGPENRVITISGPDGAKLPDAKRVLEIIAEVQKSTVEPWQEKATSTALMAQPPKAGTITKETTIPEIGVTEWTLSNGAKVVLKPTDFEAEKVHVSGDSPGGLAMAKDFSNARFADDVAGIGGVATFDDEELGKMLAGKQLTVSASIGETTESVDASASSRDLEAMFQLLYLRMTAPRKDEAMFKVWKHNYTEQLENQLKVPEVKFGIESQEALFKNNPRRMVPTPAQIAKVDQDKALAFYKDRFGDVTDFTFVIVGAFEPAKIKPLVETYLASLPGKGRKEKEKDIGVRRAPGVVKKTWNLGSEPKARVQVQFHGDETWSRDKDRDMYVLGHVLGMRLRETLRENMSGVYGVGAAGAIARRPRGERTFGIQFGCAPDGVDALIKASFAEASELAKNGVNGDYLDKVKAQFLRERETQLKNNDFWLGWLSSSYRYGDDPKIILDPSGMIARMTSDNVKASAKHYLDAKQYFQAVLMPATAPAAAAPAKTN